MVLGGYGPGYSELQGVEILSHTGVCSGVVR